jgi:chemotaxis protein histidine kinase CheA
MSEDSDLQQMMLVEFQKEAKTLLNTLYETLESIDDDYSKSKDLENYGQVVDRIMGGAKILALDFDESHFTHQIGNYAELCKAVSYKASQIQDNESLFCICLAFLMDATDVLKDMINGLSSNTKLEMKSFFNHAFLDRLKWISGKFSSEVRASVSFDTGNAEEVMDQNAIDDLMKKLGL